jgi:hypothetical protein
MSSTKALLAQLLKPRTAVQEGCALQQWLLGWRPTTRRKVSHS